MWKHVLMMMMSVWRTRKLIEMMTRWMILARLIVVIFSLRMVLLTGLIWWIDWLIKRLLDDRLIERLKIQLRVIAIYLVIEKIMIAVWLTEKIVVWLIIFLCSEIELMIELIVFELMILIFVIQIEIELFVTNNL